MNAKIRQQIERRKRRVLRRLDRSDNRGCARPMMTAANIHYEIADRSRATVHGGIGAIHLMVKQLGLDQAINDGLGLLKVHLPYHESDHVLNIAYNLLAQLKGDVRSLTAPVDNLLSNWAYMVMGSLAWSLKACAGVGIAGGGTLGRPASRRKTATVADGLSHVPRRGDSGAGADHHQRPQDRLPFAGVESVARRLLPLVGPARSTVALLRRRCPKPESGCSGPPPPFTAPECNRVHHARLDNPNPHPGPLWRRPLMFSPHDFAKTAEHS